MPKMSGSLPSVFIVEFDFLHDSRVVPIGHDDEREAVIFNILPQLQGFFREEFLFGIDNEESSIVAGIKASERESKDFDIVSTRSQMLVHILQKSIKISHDPSKDFFFYLL